MMMRCTITPRDQTPRARPHYADMIFLYQRSVTLSRIIFRFCGVARGRSPRSGIVPDFVLGVVPHGRERAGLGVHQVTPGASILPLAKISDEIEHLPRERPPQRLHLLVHLSAMVITLSRSL